MSQELSSRRVAVVEIGPGAQPVAGALRDVWRARRLLIYFIARELKGRYRATFLGSWWIVVRPTIELLPYIIVFGLFFKVRPAEIPYLVYLLSGFAPWLLFGSTISGAPGALAKARSLVSKVYFPRLVVPFSGLVIRFIDFVVVLAAALVTSLAYGIVPVSHLWALPIFVILLLMLALGTGLIVTTVCTLRSDLGLGVPAGVRLLFYLSPIIYPVDLVPESIRPWYNLNPITTVVSGIRWSLFGIDQPSGMNVSLAAAVALIVLWAGLMMFLKLERRVSDIL